MTVLSRRRALGLLAAPAILSAASAAGAQTVIFTQPTYFDGIGPHWSVTGVAPAYNPVGSFHIHSNQASAVTPDGAFSAPTIRVADLTGISVGVNRAPYTRGAGLPLTNMPYGTGLDLEATSNGSTAQMYGGTVGAYFNSDSYDQVNGTAGNRVMIAPEYTFATPIKVFASTANSFSADLDMQVPYASDGHANSMSNCYVSLDLTFQDVTSGAKVTYSAHLFNNNPGGSPPTQELGQFDDIAKVAIISGQLEPYSQRLTVAPGSEILQLNTWTGWKHFGFTVSYDQFKSGLALAVPVAASYGFTLTSRPEDLVLTDTHLNAEGHYTPGNALLHTRMGWSMQNYVVTVY